MFNTANVSARQALTYYEKDDYYTEGGKMPAAFGGSLAAELGLPTGFDLDAFHSALRGEFNRAKLKQTHSGKRAGLDCVFSAPKSVSLMALVSGDKRVLAAHDSAVQAGMRYVEQLAQVRVTDRGTTVLERAGRIAFAQFQHHTSRAGDPQLHTHNVIFNAATGPDGALRSLTNDEILRAQHAIDAVYKQHLRDGLERIGYSIDATKDGFEIRGVSKALREEFSTRRRDIDERLARDELLRDEASAAQRQRAAITTRDSKQKHDRQQLQANWLARIQELGERLPHPPEFTTGPAERPEIDAATFIESAVDHISERSAVIKSRHAIVARAIHDSSYRITLAEADSALNDAIGRGELVRGANGRALLTKHNIEREQRLLASFDEGKDKGRPIADLATADDFIDAIETGSNEPAEGSPEQGTATGTTSPPLAPGKFTSSQRKMIERVVTSADKITIVEGDAGTGKSTALNAVREIAVHQGYQVLGLAPSSKAVEALTESANIESMTTQRAQHDEQFWDQVDKDTLLVIDEAGLVDGRSMESILQNARQRDASVLLVGDTKQFQAVEAGDPLLLMKERADEEGRTIRLDEMRRARNSETHELHEAARDDPATALDAILDREDTVRIRNKAERIEAISEAYANLPQLDRNATLILTGKNEDRCEINDSIRRRLGQEGAGVQVSTFHRKDLTDVAKRQIGSYEIGDVLKFESQTQRYGKGQMLQVTARNDDRLMVSPIDQRTGEASNDPMRWTEFRPNKEAGKAVSVGHVEDTEISPGERLRFTANLTVDRNSKVKNGDRATVESIDAKSIALKLDSGQDVLLPRGGVPVALEYGYAQTGHSSQGATASKVFLHLSSDDSTVGRNSFYTNITRAADNVRVFTDARTTQEVNALKAKVSRGAERDLATDHLIGGDTKLSSPLKLESTWRTDDIERALAPWKDSKVPVVLNGDHQQQLRAAEIAGERHLHLSFADPKLDAFRVFVGQGESKKASKTPKESNGAFMGLLQPTTSATGVGTPEIDTAAVADVVADLFEPS